MNICYTCIFGKGYKLRSPAKRCNGWRYLCFTDQGLPSGCGWEVVRVPSPYNPFVETRRYKILSHEYLPEFWNISLYLDSRFQPPAALDEFAHRWLRGVSMAAMRHHKRDCVYAEAEAALAEGLVDPKLVETQMTYYDAWLEFPRHAGLWAPGVLLRRNAVPVAWFEDAWWWLFLMFPTRDQLSFPVALRSHAVRIAPMPFRETYSLCMGRREYVETSG